MKNRQVVRFLDQLKTREKRIIKPIEVGIPPLVISGKNKHPEIIKQTKDLAFKCLKQRFSRINGFALLGRPKYEVAESKDGNTYVAVKHLAIEV